MTDATPADPDADIYNAARLEVGLHPQLRSLIFHFTTPEGGEKTFVLACGDDPLPELQGGFDEFMHGLGRMLGNQGQRRNRS
jgi:hypothetical protein